MIRNKFNQRLLKLHTNLWEIIAQLDEIKGNWVAEIQLAPQILERLKRSILITSTGASTRIEGARMTDQEVDKLIKGLRIKTWTERDQQEVQGYYEVLKNVFDAWEVIPFSENSIKHLHQEMLKYAEKDARHRGNYKKMENQVIARDATGKTIGIVFDPVSAYLTPKAMQELTEWTADALKNRSHHPLLIIGNFIVEFLNIHPFQDGNGRLSRILTNLLLLKAGYRYMPYVSHEKLIEERKSDYYMALRNSQSTFKKGSGNVQLWSTFFLEVLFHQAQMALKLLQQENIEMILSEKQLKVWQYLGTVEEATPLMISKKTHVGLPTVRQALQKLMKLKKVERMGAGRGIRYRRV
ncbi:MAG: Fic family protein [Candidatus Peregrinibacteria bacterium]